MRTDNHPADSDLSEVGSQLQVYEAVLREIWIVINVFKCQDHPIVKEANSILQPDRNELEAICKRIAHNDSQILAGKGTHIGIHWSVNHKNSKIVKVNESLNSMPNSLKDVPLRKELLEDVAVMAEQIVQVQEVNTGLTMAMEAYKISETSK